jgi:hypothetical protein
MSRYDTPKRLRVRNISRRPIKRLGVVFKPEEHLKHPDGKGTVVVPAPVIEVEVTSRTGELQLRACKALEVVYLSGEPYRAERSSGSPVAAELRRRATALQEQADRIEATE